jgi:hypothetical protein
MSAPFTAYRMVLTLFVGLAVAACASAATAAPLSLREALGGRFGEGDKADSPVIGRYDTDEGGFVLDRSTPLPLLKFEDDPEIWVLQPAPGPRGDTIYRNDVGEPMLRATRFGGMTVFTPTRPDGSAAALDGPSSPLRISPLSPAALFARFYQASVRASRAAQHPLTFETKQDAEQASAAVIADAAMVASEALVDVASRTNGRTLLARVNDVVIAQGPKPSASFSKGVLTVTIVPAEGIAGRPSSRLIEHAAGVR